MKVASNANARGELVPIKHDDIVDVVLGLRTSEVDKTAIRRTIEGTAVKLWQVKKSADFFSLEVVPVT